MGAERNLTCVSLPFVRVHVNIWSKLLASLAPLLPFACKDVLRVEKRQLAWTHAVPVRRIALLGQTDHQ